MSNFFDKAIALRDKRITELESVLKENELGELARCAEEAEKQSEYEGGLLERIAELEEIVKAVAHVGVDFGYGRYELESGIIDDARALMESNNENTL